MDMAYLDGRRVLLVDDVADSGRTLDLALRLRDEGLGAPPLHGLEHRRVRT